MQLLVGGVVLRLPPFQKLKRQELLIRVGQVTGLGQGGSL